MCAKNRKNCQGFSLVELLVVIAVITILVSVTAFAFQQYMLKSKIENQTRELYGALMEIRGRTMFEKNSKLVRVSATEYRIYPSTDASVTPEVIGKLNFSVIFDNATDMIFDTQGLLKNVSSKTICVSQSNQADVDSIIISETMIRIGKRTDGANCDTGHVTKK